MQKMSYKMPFVTLNLVKYKFHNTKFNTKKFYEKQRKSSHLT